MANDRGLSIEASPELVRWLRKEGDTVVRVNAGTIEVRPFDFMWDDLRRLGWRWPALVYDALTTINGDYMGMPMRVLDPVGSPVTPLADVYAGAEDRFVRFEATLMAAGERMGVPHLVLVEDGTVMYAEDYDAKRHGAVKVQKKMDMQEVILEDTRDRDRPRRINARLYGEHMVDRWQRGQSLRVSGIYRSEMLSSKKGVAYSYWVEVIDVEPIDDASAAGWDEARVEEMRRAVAKRGDRASLDAMADSVSPQVPGARWAKLAVLLSAVGGSRLREDPPNIHALLVGPPGTGKSAIMEDVMSMLPSSAHGAAEAMSARGMTYGMEEWGGKKMLAAGVMVLKRHVGIDEFMSLPPATLDGIKVVLSSQLATYHKTGFHAETRVDCSVVACGNPAGDKWDPYAAALENLGLPAAIVTRMNVFRVGVEKDHVGRSARIKAHVLGRESARPPIERADLAGWLAWAAAQPDPKLSDGAADAIELFFTTFMGLDQKAADDVLIQSRLERAAYRNACGVARLLGAGTATADHAQVAIEMLSASMESLGLRVREAATMSSPHAPEPPRASREDSFMAAIDELERLSGEEGFTLEEVAAQMWRGQAAAFRDESSAMHFVFGSAGGRLVEQHLYRAGTAAGRFRKQ